MDLLALTSLVRHVWSGVLSVIVLLACQGDVRSHFPPRADLEEMARLFVEDGEAEHVFLSTLDADGSSDIVAFPGPPLAGLHLGSSIERVFLGTLLADMISRGEIALDSPASDYLPEEIELPTFGDRHITMLDLVTHRSGLSDSQFEAADPEAGLTDSGDFTPDVIYAALPTLVLEREPGSMFEGANAGLVLLGDALEGAAGVPLADLLEERVFSRLGMEATRFAHGATFSTMADLSAFVAAHLRPSETPMGGAIRASQEPVALDDIGAQLSLSWWVSQEPAGTFFSAVGGGRGNAWLIEFGPGLGLGMIEVMAPEYAGGSLADILRQPAVPSASDDVEVLDEIHRYEGKFRVPKHQTLYVRAEPEGYLTVQAAHGRRRRLIQRPDSTFIARRGGWVIRFVDNPSGGVGLTLRQGGPTVTGTRIRESVPHPRVVAGNIGLPVTSEEVARYAGSYVLQLERGPIRMDVFESGSRLLLSASDGLLTRIIPEGEHEYALVLDLSRRLRFTVEEGVATSASLISDDGVVATGERIPTR